MRSAFLRMRTESGLKRCETIQTSSFVRSDTWVTERSGDIGYTFRPEGGGDWMPWKESSVMDECCGL